MDELHVTHDGRLLVAQPGAPFTIGRSPDSDLVISDPTVSRQHLRLTWGAEGWVLQNLGRAGTFAGGQLVSRMTLSGPQQVSLASPGGPAVLLEPAAEGAPGAGAAAATRVDPAVPRVEPAVPRVDLASTRVDPAVPGRTGAPAPPAGGPGQGQAGVTETPAPVGPRPPWQATARMARPAAERAWRGLTSPGPREDLVTAFQILVPVQSWLHDPGWRRGLRLLVIIYGLLPLVFIALFSSSGNLTTPGWAYSLYIAPLWAIVFWLLIRPGPVTRPEVMIAGGAVAWVLIWLQLVTLTINSHFGTSGHPLRLLDAIGVGINEEIAKALPILLAALLLRRLWGRKADVRMWMFLGTLVGLTFGVREQAFYAPQAIQQITQLGIRHEVGLIQTQAQVRALAVNAELHFALRVFVDGFQHAIWAGVSGFFMGVAVNYRRRRAQLIVLGIAIPAGLHALNDWVASSFPTDYLPWILVQGVSLLLFIGYTMSAAKIEKDVRMAPLFRGDSMLMDRVTDTGGISGG